MLADIPAGLASIIVVVNNHSSDATPDIAKKLGAVVLEEPRMGYGYACMKGVQYLYDMEAEPGIVVFLDADYSDYPQEMAGLVKPIVEQDYDLVLGWRSPAKMEKSAMPLQQAYGNRLAVGLITLLFGVKFHDLGPFRAIKLDKLADLEMQDKTYGWPVEMQLKAVKRNFRICEVPVSYRKRIGKSKISGTIRGTVLAGYKIIGTILKYSRYRI